MTILITGANGFLGHYLIPALLNTGHRVVATGTGPCRLEANMANGIDYAEMDLTDPDAIARVFQQFTPALVVHAGAMTRPDDCELQREKAWEVNVAGTRSVLQEAAAAGAKMLYVSTDFVFDGMRGMYSEADTPSPVNYYGQTKLEAEELIKTYVLPWAIVRTVLVYGRPLKGRSNMLSIVQEKLLKGEPYYVVDDQFRTPTWVGDLVAGLMAVIRHRATGIWHISGQEGMTPYEMACRTAAFLGLNENLLIRVTAATFTQPATRPPRTGFNIAKAQQELGFQPHNFEAGLRFTFEND